MSGGRLSWPAASWLAVKGGRSDVVRIVLTAVGSAVGTLALLSAATVISIGPEDGPYSTRVLEEPGLHKGVVTALVLLCIPILAFVGQCARIGAPARDRRLAAIRLAGGTPRDVIRVACGETGIAAGIGAVTGLGLYLLGRVLLGWTSVETYAVFTEVPSSAPGAFAGIGYQPVTGPVLALPTDVLPPLWTITALVFVIPLAAAAFTRLALRRVAISPFGVTRHRSTRPPRLLPAILFGAGVLALALMTTVVRTLNLDLGTSAIPALAALALLLITSAGLVLGNAALAAGIGSFVAPRARRPAVLIAARRLAADPYAASRAFAALLLTVLVGAGAQGVRAFTLASTEPSDPFYADTLDLVDLVIVVAVVVASLGLLVVAAEGIVARRRALAALSAAGTPVGVLRRAVLAEVLLPLLPSALLAAAAGLFAARGLFGTTFVDYEYSRTGQLLSEQVTAIPVPWARLGVLVGGTVAVTLLVTAVSLLWLRPSIDPAELRAAA
ncbi:MAG: ABC transporter permease [Actinomycetota bacterium]|nr:ABC transporter permease [Actinomycetota bacterium]